MVRVVWWLPAGLGLEPWVVWLLLCDQGVVLAFSEPVRLHLTMGRTVGPPLEVKGGFSDIVNVK